MTSLLPPPIVAPFEYQGIRYQQDRATQFEGREFGATYLSALDIATNALLWVIKICDCLRYPEWHEPGGPPGIGFVAVSKMALGPNENELMIETDVDSRYLVDLQTRTVTLLPAPEPVKKHQKIPQADPSDPPMPPPWLRRDSKVSKKR